MNKRFMYVLVVVCFMSCGSVAVAQTGLLAGAARVDITPSLQELPKKLTTIHDHLYIRALMIESNGTRSAIAVVEVPAIAPDIYADLLQKISQEFNVPKENIMLGTTHTHNSMRVAPPGPSPIPTSEKFTAMVKSGTMEALRTSQARLQPARAGYTAGHASMVAGRNEWYPSQHRYIDGIDRTGKGAVDQTLGVYKFESLTGKPIAAILNYGIEPVVYELASNEVSGDVPGATSRYIEDSLKGDFVAIFTIGSPASPAYRVWYDEDPNRDVKTAATIMNAMGVILGEEVLARMKEIKASPAPIKITAATDSLVCPGKQTTPRNLRNHCAYTEDSKLPPCEFTDKPFKDVTLNMGVLRLGDVTYVVADGNVVPALWEKLKQISPVSYLQFVGANFGQFRFVVDDAAYALNTYPATDTRAVVNCAEQGFLTGVLGLIEATR